MTQDLPGWLRGFGSDSFLFAPGQLRERLDALNELDVRCGDLSLEEPMNGLDPGSRECAKSIRTRIEAANTVLYEAMRAEIVGSAPPHTLLHWIQGSPKENEIVYGLGYDYRDEIVSGVLQLREPGEPRLHPAPEMVFYQPTPVRHILHLIRASGLSQDDVFVDLGSGLGHVALLVSMLTRARSIGIEVEGAYAASAQECAQQLQQRNVRFIHEDARTSDLSRGTVFYLYSPFVGSILTHVLNKLQKEATHRQIKICALGPCTHALSTASSWLKPMTPTDPKRITVFHTL